MKRQTVALVACLALVVFAGAWYSGKRQTDASNRFVAQVRSVAGIVPTYGPKLADPTLGYRHFIEGVLACVLKSDVDDCMRSAPRCESQTPWKGDPAGDKCCPEACLEKYLENRKTQKAEIALTNLDRSCYPGLSEALGQPAPNLSGAMSHQ